MPSSAFRAERIRLLVSSVIVPTLMLGVVCSRKHESKHAIFLLLDAARPDRFSCYGYHKPTTPHIDSLAAAGWLFENHFTHDTDTRSGLPPLFFSRYFSKPLFPLSSGIPLEEPANLFRRNDDECLSLPRILTAAGFRTGLISAHPWIKSGTELADGFNEVVDISDFPDARGRMPNADEMIDRVIDLVEHNANVDYFIYAHLMDTHFPHTYGGDAEALAGPSKAGSRAFDQHGRPRNRARELLPVERRYLDAVYDGSLRYADRAIGRLVSRLRSDDALGRTMIIITSDHGEHLLEHVGRFEHGGPWYDTVARVPLIVSYGMHTEPKRIHSMSEAVDLLPTILGLLNVPIPHGISSDGVDLGAMIRRGEEKPAVFMYKGMRTATHKLLLDSWRVALEDEQVDVGALGGRLYNVSKDPDELHDVWEAELGRVGELIETYRAAMAQRFDRFQSAMTNKQPRSAFAISAKNFDVAPRPLSVSTPLHREAYRMAETNNDWMLSDYWEDPWLLGEAGASPVTIQFRVPDGPYEVSVAMAGQCTLEAGSNSVPSLVEGLSIIPGEEVKCRPYAIGEVTVRNELFEATVKPRVGEKWVLLKYFGFKPVVEGVEQLDSEAMKRLRALGYLD